MSFSADTKKEIKEWILQAEGRKDNKRGNAIDCNIALSIARAFVDKGSISDPEKAYHIEFVCANLDEGILIQDYILKCDIIPGIAKRKDKVIVYVNDFDSIIKLLNVMGATNSLLYFENIKVIKETRTNVQRQVNFETANISKSARAYLKDIENINIIKEHGRYDELDAGLKQVAKYRIKYPDESLSELSRRIGTITKSGVSHRLRKIADIAESINK